MFCIRRKRKHLQTGLREGSRSYGAIACYTVPSSVLILSAEFLQVQMLTGTKIGIREIPDDPDNRSLNIAAGLVSIVCCLQDALAWVVFRVPGATY